VAGLRTIASVALSASAPSRCFIRLKAASTVDGGDDANRLFRGLTFGTYDMPDGSVGRMALSRADVQVIREVVSRLHAEHAEREAGAIERLMQQALAPDSTPALAGYMTTGEAAGLIGVSLQTVKNWVQRGRLVGSRVGGRTLVTRRSVQAFFDSLGTAPGPTEEEDDAERVDAADHELMTSLPSGLAVRVEALLDRQRAGLEVSASEHRELHQLAHAGTAAATRHTRTLIPHRPQR
jgi:excisionase family DNA binding protein